MGLCTSAVQLPLQKLMESFDPQLINVASDTGDASKI